MAEPVGDNSIYLRFAELQKGMKQFTDTTNAYRLFQEHGKDIRYNAFWKKWIVWDGKHWQMDNGYLIQEKGLQTIQGIYAELIKTEDYRDRYDIENHAKQSESLRRRKACVEVASWIPELNITAEDLDTDPWLFNVENGTINLKTGEFREHRQEDMITRLACVSYDPGADCPLWEQFIREIMDFNTELIDFVQVSAGWALTGDTSEQTMFIFHGSGANGKSTFLNTIMRLFGDYAIAASTETFMKKSGGSDFQ